MLGSDSADLPVALGRVAIAKEEEGPLGPDWQVDGRPRTDIREIHIAAVISGRECAHRIYLRRGADGANEWAIRKLDALIPSNRHIRNMQFLDYFGERIMKHRGQIGAREAPKVRDQACCTPWLRTS